MILKCTVVSILMKIYCILESHTCGYMLTLVTIYPNTTVMNFSIQISDYEATSILEFRKQVQFSKSSLICAIKQEEK